VAVLALIHAGVAAQSVDNARDRAPCVSCLVIGVEAAALESAPPLQPGSLDGVQLLVTNEWSSNRFVDLIRSIQHTGASVAVLVGAPAEPRRSDEVVFEVRTRITALHAAKPDLQVVIDADALAAAGVAVELLKPYADALLGDAWSRLPSAADPSVDDLVAASLVPGGERVFLPIASVDWRVLQDFSARRPAVVEVTGARHLTVGEILARYQAQQHRQDSIVKTTIGMGTTTLLFEVPDFAAPVTITAETTIFRGPDGTNIEEKGIRVNGAPIAGGSAASPPELPLIDAERISTPPLTITLNEAYRYALDGEESIGESRCYVIRFEPSREARGLARGRAWIDTRNFTLRRLETVQRDLRSAVVSSEQVDEFGRVDAAGTVVWLPMETRIFQSYEGAGLRTPIHRTIAVRQYQVNSPTFEARLANAFASDNVMLRDTPDGLRYLVRRGATADRSVPTRGNHTIRSLVGGVLVDPGISRPLAFGGVSYVNLDLFGRGAQLNVFFGGVFGQASWSLPSVAGTKWQAHGSVFAIATQFSDRVFRNGRERYSENLLQQPGHLSVGLLRPLTPRLRVTADYAFNITALRPGASTPALFEVPSRVVDHGAVLALDADRGAWNLRGWWNPAVRHRWHRWGLPGTFDAATGDYQRYGARVTRTLALQPSVSSRLEISWMGGRDLDRFSRYGFDAFENQLHGYPTDSIRFDRGIVFRSATAWTMHRARIDGFVDAAYVHDPGWASAARAYPGVGAGVESGGPLRTLLSFEWAYGFRAPRTDGGRGTQVARVTVYRGF
jgi:hypothetical protein